MATGAPEAEVQAALRQALAQPDAGTDARLTTLAQLSRIAPGHAALALLKPDPVLHYSGHMIAAQGAETWPCSGDA